MPIIISTLAILFLIQAIRLRHRTWKTAAYYRTLRINLLVHAIIPCAIAAWGMFPGDDGPREAIERMFGAMRDYAWGFGFLLVAFGWPLSVLHMLKRDGLGCTLAIWFWPAAVFASFIPFMTMMGHAGSGSSPLLTLAVLMIGFASLGVVQTVCAPFAGAINLLLLLQLFPDWSAGTTVEFLSGAFELFDVQTRSLSVILMIASISLSLLEWFDCRP